jgi:hypothetical protein
MNTIEKLQKWYGSRCSGDPEHGYGITIITLDNPGWHISIDLEKTGLEMKPFDEILVETSEADWMTCTVDRKQFQAFCSPLNLDRALEIFLQWADI